MDFHLVVELLGRFPSGLQLVIDVLLCCGARLELPDNLWAIDLRVAGRLSLTR